MTPDEALVYCDDLLEDIDRLPDRADFKEDVGDKVASIREWIEDHDHITDAMERALENIRVVVDKWLAPMTTAVQRYVDLLRQLLEERTHEEDEAREELLEQLDDCWWEMTDAERADVEGRLAPHGEEARR